jgi:hypothetical protein
VLIPSYSDSVAFDGSSVAVVVTVVEDGVAVLAVGVSNGRGVRMACLNVFVAYFVFSDIDASVCLCVCGGFV